MENKITVAGFEIELSPAIFGKLEQQAKLFKKTGKCKPVSLGTLKNKRGKDGKSN